MICLWMERIERIIEKLNHIAIVMEMPKFPCVKIEISNNSIDFVSVFIKSRIDENWLILANDSAHHQQQLWTAWLFAQRSFHNGRALARSIDAEFLRYIAGTHHVSEAFKTVGFGHGDKSAWLIYLPKFELIDGEYYPIIDEKMYNNEVIRLSKEVEFEVIESNLSFNQNGLAKLGIDFDIDGEKMLNILISNIISTDLNS